MVSLLFLTKLKKLVIDYLKTCFLANIIIFTYLMEFDKIKQLVIDFLKTCFLVIITIFTHLMEFDKNMFFGKYYNHSNFNFNYNHFNHYC